MRRDDICIYVGLANRARLEAIIADRNSTSKAVWRARIVLATAEGHGTNAIMRLTSKSKPCVWRWQERYLAEGVNGLLRDKTRPSGKKPLSRKVRLKVLAKTANATPVNATHWSRASMPKTWPLRRASATVKTSIQDSTHSRRGQGAQVNSHQLSPQKLLPFMFAAYHIRCRLNRSTMMT